MRVFFQLYKRHAKLAAAEALTATNGKRIALLKDELLIADVPHARFDRLGLSSAAYEFLFQCAEKQLDRAISRFDWQKHYRVDFKVVAHHASTDVQHELGHLVANQLTKPKANLRSPKTAFHFFFLDNDVIVGKLLWQNTEDFESRKVHHWPAPHPTGTHPQLARAMVNLTGIERGKLVDPFCGAGGMLIEAGLMGLRPAGYDIEPELLEKASKNLNGFGIKKYTLALKDARTLSGTIPHLVADLPYGRNTPRKGLEELYAAFLSRLKNVLTKRAVLGFPSTIAHKHLIKNAGLIIVAEFDWEINRRLTKKIVVVENPSRM